MNANEIENLPAGKKINQTIWWLIFDMSPTPLNNDINYLPDYSGDMNVAFSVVNKLEEHPNEILFSLTRKGSTHEKLKWCARFRECLGYQKEFYVEAETAPLAICRAALLAVMPR